LSGQGLGKLLLAQAESEPYRRNTRIPLEMPITVRGQDKMGKTFEERTATIDVSKKGIKTSTLHPLLLNAKVRISNGHPHKPILARVAWQAHTDRPNERVELGVEFLDAFEIGHIRNIASHPEDWEEGYIPLTPTQKLEYFWARGKQLQEVPELEINPDADLPSSTSMSPVAPAPGQQITGERPAKNEVMWEDIKSEIAELHPPIASGKPIQGSRKITTPPDSPTAAMNQLAQLLCEQAETITQGVDRAMSSVQSTAEKSLAALELARQQIEVQLGTASLDHKKRLTETSGAAADALRESSETLQEKFRKELQLLIETQLQTAGNQQQERFAEISARSTEEVRRNSEALLEDFRKQLQIQVETQLEAVAAEHQKQLAALVVSSVQQVRDVAGNFKDQSTRQLAELKETNLELQHQNEEYMRTCQGKVRDEIQAAKSAVAPRGILWILSFLVMAAFGLLIFAYASTKPVLQLQSNPPAEFVDPGVNPNQQEAEGQLARAYWNATVHNIQQTYKFQTILPDKPPSEFQVQPQDVTEISSSQYLDASRTRYWQRLRKIWDNPQIWQSSYEWNTDWIMSPLKSLGQMLRR
jgi:PilZ domain